MRRHLAPLLAVALLAGGLGLPAGAQGAEPPLKVAVIVGPVGAELTPVYLDLAETAALAAEARGATVARAYSPNATAERVLAAVEGASIVVYLGHGVGSPNPYTDHPDPATTNGWGLNGPHPSADHGDAVRDGSLAYYGEDWIAANARPAPGWVMIYSNACYAPGAGEGFEAPADEATAAARVAAYSRTPLTRLGASAYFATDFFAGAAHLVGALLDAPDAAYADIFASEPRFEPAGLARLAHPDRPGAETWLQRSAYFAGKLDYWYAFAGDPTATFAGGSGSVGQLDAGLLAIAPAPIVTEGVATGRASSYAETAGWEGQATVALPLEIGVAVDRSRPTQVLVCADRCVTLPVVDSCPCYVGTADQRVANLSHAAWALVTDLPLEEGLVDVSVHLSPVAPSPPGGPPLR